MRAFTTAASVTLWCRTTQGRWSRLVGPRGDGLLRTADEALRPETAPAGGGGAAEAVLEVLVGHVAAVADRAGGEVEGQEPLAQLDVGGVAPGLRQAPLVDVPHGERVAGPGPEVQVAAMGVEERQAGADRPVPADRDAALLDEGARLAPSLPDRPGSERPLRPAVIRASRSTVCSSTSIRGSDTSGAHADGSTSSASIDRA